MNWKTLEVLMAVRDGVPLTPAQQARLELAQEHRTSPGGLRRALALGLVALAHKLDPEPASTVGQPESLQARPA